MQALRKCVFDISVIVPVYNLEKFLPRLLQSLKEQRLGDYRAEYIFVLNNCTDGSEQVIRDSKLYCRILNCTEQGCGPARNAGLDIAQGEYIWMMDGDDWLLTDTAIQEALDKAHETEADILRVPFQSDTYKYNYYSMVWQYLLRREFVAEFRFPAIQPAEDDVYMRQVLRKAGRDDITYLRLPKTDRPLYFYNYLREGSNMWRHYRGEKI